MFITDKYDENGKKLSFVIEYPGNFDESKKYPVIFYFHGMCTESIEKLKNGIPIRRELMTEDMPFIIVAPFCECFTWIECFETLTSFVDYIIAKDYVDDKRVYITGSSMGGYTCWAQAVMFPDKFAAAVICCGAGMYFAADRIKFPVWAFHGRLDDTVLPRESEIMVERINKSGGNAKLTVVEECGHNVWDVAFTSYDIYKWILSNSK